MGNKKKPAIRFKGFTEAWEQRKLGDVFKYEQPQSYIVKSTEYNESYATPVLTAGQSFLLGFTNESTGIKTASKECPVIIFDDFTTSSHFVDFPFKIKSSAMKLLTLAKSNDDIYCGYNILKNIGYIPVNHERHWISIFSNFDVLIPVKTEEQKRIGKFLKNLDHLITLHQRKYDKLKNIKKSLLEKMFPQNGSDVPEIRFKGFTEAWEQRKVFEIANRYDNLRIPVAENLRKSGLFPYYGANGIQDFVNGYTHDGEYVLVAEDGANDLKNYPVQYVSGKIWVNNHAHVLQGIIGKLDNMFLSYLLHSVAMEPLLVGGGRAKLNAEVLMGIELQIPNIIEQQRIGECLSKLDTLITLHQRELYFFFGGLFMLDDIECTDLFCEYYEKWIMVYKQGAIRKVTMDKYLMTHQWLAKLVPNLKICELNRIAYQQLLNDYAMYHERQTTMDFHHQLKGAILDAVDEGLIERDPTRKAIIKGKQPAVKKNKYLNQFELHTLLASLDLKTEVNWDYFILLVAKTGMRFSEALALTPRDFDFSRQTVSITKTWDYKGEGGFQPTKNKSSERKIQIDWQTVVQFSELLKKLPPDKPIFVDNEVYNSTVNEVLKRHCQRSGIPVISIHGLRHTHASILLFAGVSIASVARRLGHASMTTTQKTYLHIIQELENQDVDLVMRSLSGL